MAADQKAVGSTAADQEEHSQKVVRDAHLMAKESRSEKGSHSVIDRAEASVKAARENLSQATGHADHSAKAAKEDRSATDHADHSLKTEKEDHSKVVRKEEVSVKAEKEGHSETGHAEASAKVVKENLSETGHAETSARAVKENHSQEREGHSAQTGKDSAEREDHSEQRRASTRRISTISVTRRRAASTR